MSEPFWLSEPPEPIVPADGDLVGEVVPGRRKPELDLFDPGRILA